jgi:hypothetical protein
LQISVLGKSLGAVVDGLRRPGIESLERAMGAKKVVLLAEEMDARARDLLNKQEQYVVPYVKAYVKAGEQKRFNNKVRVMMRSIR